MTSGTTTPRQLTDIVDDAARPVRAAYWEAVRVPGLDELVCSAAADAMTADIMAELAQLADPRR